MAAGTGPAPLPLLVTWWSADNGFAGPLDPVPTTVAAGGADAHAGVYLVGIAHVLEREAARRAIRDAIHAALARLCGVAEGDIDVPAGPGETPFAAVATGAASLPRRIALAISHDEDISVAAIGMDRAVGIDVMRIEAIPDWQALARDYLGPDVAASLAALSLKERPAALARAWSEREARLKCFGRPLDEWHAGDDAALASCACGELALPAGYVGVVALGQPNT